MIYLHQDLTYRDNWWQRFEFLLRDRGLPHKTINLLRDDENDLLLSPEDGLVGRFGHHPSDFHRMRGMIPRLGARLAGRIFPRPSTYWYYNDKARQLDLFERAGYPTPPAAAARNMADVDRFLDETGLDFPLVAKTFGGAGSSGVRLARCRDELIVPGIVQEFCRDNECVYRVTVIGQQLMLWREYNRPDDFRASGGGLFKFIDTDQWDLELADLAYRVACDCGFESTGFDCLRDNEGRWVILEFTYAYGQCARDCEFYLQMPDHQFVRKPGIYPQDMILEDFLQTYGIASPHPRPLDR